MACRFLSRERTPKLPVCLDKSVKTVSSVSNIVRVYSEVGYARYSSVLQYHMHPFGGMGQWTILRDVPLHLNEPTELTVTCKALAHFGFDVAGLFGEV